MVPADKPRPSAVSRRGAVHLVGSDNAADADDMPEAACPVAGGSCRPARSMRTCHEKERLADDARRQAYERGRDQVNCAAGAEVAEADRRASGPASTA